MSSWNFGVSLLILQEWIQKLHLFFLLGCCRFLVRRGVFILYNFFYLYLGPISFKCIIFFPVSFYFLLIIKLYLFSFFLLLLLRTFSLAYFPQFNQILNISRLIYNVSKYFARKFISEKFLIPIFLFNPKHEFLRFISI
jgi:hypothetical protein